MIRWLKSSPTVFIFILPAAFFLAACGSGGQDGYIPKPKGYQRIELPPHAYTRLPDKHPYTFQISKYARVLPDSFAPNEPDWIFIDYPKNKANIQLTYKKVNNNPKLLKEYIEDSYKLAAKHQIHATAIQEQILVTPNGKTVTFFRLLGDVPSPYQFYTTDSTRHFLRGAIYFPVANKGDSLAPVIDYLKADLLELINTLSWRN
ncbi:gliding motility lipoprotein GldD [Ravibacter arvi]|uniref:Gliding motility lipoprotein GldD n=1 Tax=Ravibacter arvi TaxID=2051041 RepID=A0ABP8M3T3_9BACT